ncbi:MAG: FIST signal transduction protein [Brevinematia bacterium]
MEYVNALNIFKLSGADWAVCYTTVDVDIKSLLNKISEVAPKIKIFGCSSFQGVFTPEGFLRGAHFLVSSQNDGIEAYPVIYECSAEDAKEKTILACKEIEKNFGSPDVILMHAVPGFEERVVEGIDEVFLKKVKVYGGSAADDDISGKWFIFSGNKVLNQGVLLVAFRSAKKIYSTFLSGYLPTNKKGIITKAEGRIVYEIDNRPAALVYNEWTNGSISEYLEKGGIILAPTTLRPLGRVIGEVMGIKNYLLSHPHSVIPENKALTLFTEFKVGDEVILMSGYKSALFDRARQVVERALGVDKNRVKLKGAIFIYCGGCVGAIIDEVNNVVEQYRFALSEAPFVGAATFGEQGCFIIREKENRHGNLMANSILFS